MTRQGRNLLVEKYVGRRTRFGERSRSFRRPCQNSNLLQTKPSQRRKHKNSF